VVGFGAGPLSLPANMALQRCVDRWVDTADADPATVAMMVRNERIDLLIDLAGLAAPAMHAALARRMAPCQVAWLGTPYPTGLAGIDFVLTDRVLDPAGSRLAVWPARRQHLALGAVVMPPLPPLVDRPAGGEADAEGPVLAAEATLADLTTPQIALWASVLHQIPRAVLVLRQGALAEPAAARRLVDLFGNHGVAHRVEIAALPSAHALFATADVALIPSAVPRPAVIAAALANGIPPLLLEGRLRHQLGAQSVLAHLGLAEDCLAQSPAAFIAAAAAWAGDGARRRAFRERIADLQQTAAALDGRARMRDLERAFTAMWRQTCGAALEPTRTGAAP
jgi:predicted O-linked N-acetylglucosamine transferase (SPINDLY family)